MAKNILVITGSGRKDGNSELMADAFIKGARENGHTVEKFQAGLKSIKGCMGCDACWTQGRACIFKDDFMELEPLVTKANALIFVSPLYWFGVTAQLKTAIDKMYAAFSAKAPVKPAIKETALLMCGEATEEYMYMYDGAIKSFELMADYLEWQNKGVLIVPGVLAKGDIRQTDGLAKAEALGREM